MTSLVKALEPSEGPPGLDGPAAPPLRRTLRRGRTRPGDGARCAPLFGPGTSNRSAV
ncbi:hypothetical protein ACFT9I_18475 [Streptomyces sp. NPDC057137]|uniref:hypothetical protein n=1 Tax=Streptomyces sp. NPDC057137 TaxID=3346030 RepID=UPI003631BF2F